MGVPDVVGVAEIADRLGVGKSRANQLVRQPDFPEGTKLAQGWVFDAADVEEWIREHRPDLAR